ncbi:MAG: hypothetical protein RIQ93_2771 [Verrucomicrobiota bacterium]|jgi:hypothetical protein
MTAAILVRLVFWFWFGAAILAGNALLLQQVSPPAVPALVFTLAALLLLLYFRIPPLRAWVQTVPLRTLVLLHVARYAGLVFLYLHHRGQLPFAFAVPGGFGEIAVATFALPVALAPLSDSARLRATRIWNIAGLANILFILVTAIQISLEAPAEIRALTYLPLSLLPTFLAPLIIATHVIIFIRATED